MAVQRVADADDPRLADYRDLKDATLRRRRGLFVAESRQVVRRLVAAARWNVRSVLATEAAFASLRDVLPPDGPPVFVVSEATIRSVVGFEFHRGCIALGERGDALPLDVLLGARRLVVLDRVGNPDNVGGIFRNAMAFGVDGMVLSPGCGDPLYRKAIRVSMGGALVVPFVRSAAWEADLVRLRETGFTLVALTPDGGTDLAALRATRRTALVVGAESEGVGNAARHAVDAAVAIAMAPGDHSLNVATATGIALHWLTRGNVPPAAQSCCPRHSSRRPARS
jgi:tRNA G18 (ribose-2'-O)-methylase SpoU